MTKRKSILSFVLAICLIIPCAIMLSACGHNHTASTKWSSDATEHWHVCTDEKCDEKLDVANHTWNDGVITTEATEETEAIKTFTCTVCGKTKTENVTKTVGALSFNSSYNPSKVYNGQIVANPTATDYTNNSDGAISIDWFEKAGGTYSTTAMASAPVNAGTYKIVITVAGTKYYSKVTAEKEVTISPKQLTINGTTVADKEYDGTVAAIVTKGTLAGLVSGEEVSVGVTATGVFASKDVAYDLSVDEQDVTISYSLTGALAKNYLAPVTETKQAKINPKTLSDVSLTKVYDGNGRFQRTALTTAQGLIAGESIKIYVDAINANAGVYKDGNEDEDFDLNEYVLYIGDSENQTSNYVWGDSCTATITTKQLTIASSNNYLIKYYDGTTNFSQAVEADSIGGIVGGDDVTVNMTGTLHNKNVGAGQLVEVTYSLSGEAKDNYSLVTTSAIITVIVQPYNFNRNIQTGCASGIVYVTAQYVNNSGNVTFEDVVVSGDIFEGDTITATISKNGDSSKMGCTEYKSNETNIVGTHYTITFGGDDVGNYQFGTSERYNPNVYLTIYEQEATADVELTYSKTLYNNMEHWIKVDLQKQNSNGYSIVAATGTTIDTNTTKMYDMAGNEVSDMKPTANGTYFILVKATSDTTTIGMTITSPSSKPPIK